MTERKPADLSWDSWIDRQIREGQQSGAFDDLDGHGRPLPGIDAVHDEMWWVKAKLRDEDIDYLPPTIAIRAERAAAIDAALRETSEARALLLIDDVNARIRYINSHAASGPPSTAVAVDVDAFLERWRSVHPDDAAQQGADENRADARADDGRRRARWWHQLLRWRPTESS